MGASAPMMMQMSIAPFEAQKRAENLGQAESAAVTFAATNEGNSSFTDLPDNCDLSSPADGSFTVILQSRVWAQDMYRQSVP